MLKPIIIPSSWIVTSIGGLYRVETGQHSGIAGVAQLPQLISELATLENK
jgi:hypothetical protein